MAPEYYGLLMFAQAAPPGSRLIATTATNAEGITVWATRGRKGHTRVVLINESLRPPHDRAELRRAAVRRRSSGCVRPRLTSTTGVTLGGQSFGAKTTTGRLAGRSSVAKLTASQGRYVFTLPAESAALVTF